LSDSRLLERITSHRDIFGGKPIVRGMRISVELILSLLAQGEPLENILADYPDLEPEDVRACIAYVPAVVAQERLDRNRLERECAKLDPKEEREIAGEGLGADLAEWPKY
jgi:uncharacterized protein (DUF433 family)